MASCMGCLSRVAADGASIQSGKLALVRLIQAMLVMLILILGQSAALRFLKVTNKAKSENLTF